MSKVSVVIPIEGTEIQNNELFLRFVAQIQAEPLVLEIILSGQLSETMRAQLDGLKARTISIQGGRGAAIKAALGEAKGEIVVLQDPDIAYNPSDYANLVRPLISREADASYGVRFGRLEGARQVGSFQSYLADFGLSLLCGAVTDLSLADAETGLKAFRSEIIKGMPLSSKGAGIDSEIAVKFAAQLFRIHQVPISFGRSSRRERIGERLQRALTLMRYATSVNDADDRHEGYNTLLRIEEGAPRYNGWLSKKLSHHLGNRVLEVGAGIGTMTKFIAPGRELVVALEMDRFYYDRLKNLFAQSPQVIPHLAGVEAADWQALRSYKFESVLLSNVLEHIADDRSAVLNFRSVLEPGGKLVILVPANPMLFGSIDEAVGHFRRYTRRALTELLESAGFTLESLESMNVLGIPGWFVNGRVLKRRAIPPLQLRAYDLLAPFIAQVEDRLAPPVGMSLLAVARAT